MNQFLIGQKGTDFRLFKNFFLKLIQNDKESGHRINKTHFIWFMNWFLNQVWITLQPYSGQNQPGITVFKMFCFELLLNMSHFDQNSIDFVQNHF